MTEQAEISAWQLRLHPQEAADQHVVFVVPELNGAVACTPASAYCDTPDGLHVLHLPGGIATPHEGRQRAEAWVAASSQPIELLLQSDRIQWAPGRAVIIGNVLGVPEYLCGLAAFSFLEAALRGLEQRITLRLAAAEPDTDLTHRIDRTALRRWPEIGRATHDVTAMHLLLVRIAGALEHPPDRLPSQARRLFAELAIQTEVSHRLERAEARVEALWELYELVNSRLSEFSYFRREYLVEWLIVLILAGEAVLLLLGLDR